MQVNSIQVSQFRNLSSQKINFPDKCSLICGKNGQGKTSILEAIYTAAHARSFRTSKLRELICWGKKEAAVQLIIDTTDGIKDLEFLIKFGKKNILINGNKVEKASLYYGQITCTAFTPESMQLVQGGPAIRRRFIDRSLTMIDPLSVDTLVQYQRALKSRNSILLENKSGFIINSVSAETKKQLDVWEQILSEYGAKIISTRTKFINLIQPLTQKYYRLLSKDSEKIHLNYSSNAQDKPISEIVDYLKEKLLAKRRDDALSQRTAFGPHRDELEIKIDFRNGPLQDARQTASQGQCRSIALSLTMAVVEHITNSRRQSPIVLLDDVESELDIYRRGALFEVLEGFNSQTIITATEPSEGLLKASNKPGLLMLNSGKLEL